MQTLFSYLRTTGCDVWGNLASLNENAVFCLNIGGRDLFIYLIIIIFIFYSFINESEDNKQPFLTAVKRKKKKKILNKSGGTRSNERLHTIQWKHIHITIAIKTQK